MPGDRLQGNESYRGGATEWAGSREGAGKERILETPGTVLAGGTRPVETQSPEDSAKVLRNPQA